MSQKQKTAAEIRGKIAKLQAALEAQERAERERIGAAVQKLTGRETWPEIKPLISVKGGIENAI